MGRTLSFKKENESLVKSREPTPLPKKAMAILGLVFLGDSISISVIFPFVPFMVQHFFDFPEDQQNQIGYYAQLHPLSS